MTRKEQAYVKRLEKRRRELFTALAIIEAWLSLPEDSEDILFQIAKLCTERLEADKEAERKEKADDNR